MTSEAARIAAALRRSPVYVDPSLAAALPGPERLVRAIESAPMPVYAIVLPLVRGGEWSDAEHLAADVHRSLRRDGVYLTLGEDSTDSIKATEFGVDRDAIEAAGAVGLDPAMDEVSLTDRLIRCIRLMASGQAHAAYKTQTDRLDHVDRPHEPARTDHTPYAIGGGAAVAVAGLGALLVWRHRRMARAPGPRPARTSARSAAELRHRAEAALLALGESLEDAQGGTDLLQRALDAYAAAGKALDAARTVPDLAGVLVLVDMGDDASRGRGPSPLCFFNPLHGGGRLTVTWRAVGGRDRLKVAACAECARAVRTRTAPDVLLDGTVPYYEVDPDRSVWAATGYGQIRGDLVQRVLRGDLRRA